MKRKNLLFLFWLMPALGMMAQSLDYITFRTANGTERSMTAVGTTITFKDGQITATNGADKATWSLSELSTMFFSSQATGIETATTQPVTVAIINGQLQVTAPNGSNISVYTADGRLVSGNNLTKGLYIVRVNQQTFKVLAK